MLSVLSSFWGQLTLKRHLGSRGSPWWVLACQDVTDVIGVIDVLGTAGGPKETSWPQSVALVGAGLPGFQRCYRC